MRWAMNFHLSNPNGMPNVAVSTGATLSESRTERPGCQLAGSIGENGAISNASLMDANETKPHQPRWPVLVIGFAATVTLLWISVLSWLLWRILIFIF